MRTPDKILLKYPNVMNNSLATSSRAKAEFSNILAIDPGGTTGVAFQVFDRAENMLIVTTTVTEPEELYDIVIGTEWDEIVCEKFSTAGLLSKYGLLTIELVGGVRALAYCMSRPFHYRAPQNRKAFQDEAKNTYFAAMKHIIHEEDSLAHLLAWKWKMEHDNE